MRQEKAQDIAPWINRNHQAGQSPRVKFTDAQLDEIAKLQSDAYDAKGAAIFFGVLFFGIACIVGFLH